MPRTALTALMLCLAAQAFAQESEIFIPDAGAAPTFDAPEPQSRLALCLMAPDAACAGIGAAADGAGPVFESAGALTYETLVLDLDSGTVARVDAPPAVPPDYAATMHPAQGRIELPSVAITIAFDYDSHLIRSDQQVKLAELVTALRDPALAGTRYAVIGHTDARGSAGYNCDLSRRRAAEVTRNLESADVVLPLHPLGFGEAVPKNTGDPTAAENRRVTFMRLPDDPGTVIETAAAVCGY